MDLKGILSISGHSGLFKLIKQSKTGFIVESLTDGKRIQAFASSKISTLEDIAIYTETGEVHLKEVLQKIFKAEEEKQINLSAKSSNEELKEFFLKILPEYDKERVYVSDIRKVVIWYNLLVEKGLVDLVEDKKEPNPENVDQEEKTQEIVEEKTEEKTDNQNKSETAKTPRKKPVKKAKKDDVD